MKAYEFINSNIGASVIVLNKGDLAFECEMRRLIYQKPELILLKLTRAGMALVAEGKKTHTIPPRCLRLAHEFGDRIQVLNELIKWQERYIEVLCQELSETSKIAFYRGWRSTRHDEGFDIRCKMQELKERII